jgi:perosamine synthetase
VSHPYLALSLALEAMGMERGDSIAISALSPSLHVRVARDKGLLPLLSDVDPETGSIDPKEAEKLMDRRPKAIVVSHSLGIMADVETIKGFGVPVIEDCSQGLGGRIGETLCGGVGDAAIISLAPEDIVTCGGGAVVLAKGRNATAQLRRIAESTPLYSPLADMNAALGISQIASLDRFIAARRELQSAYTQSLMRSRHKFFRQKSFRPEEEVQCVLSSFPVLLLDGLKEARQYAMKKNVETVQAFGEVAVSRDDMTEFKCPNARSLMLRCLLFPLYPMLGRREAETVQKVLATLP